MDQRTAANNSKQLFAGVRSAGYEQIGHYLSCTKTTVSELAGKEKYKFNFNTCAELLARLGLKIVPAEYRCYNPDDIERIMYFAKRGMESMNPESLEWDGEE